MLVALFKDGKDICYSAHYYSQINCIRDMMDKELLSVVDENDRVIDTLPRAQIHALGLPHRAVHILVFNENNELFLQKRSHNKDLNKGLWDTSAAGHVDTGEDYFTTAVREAKEELGINIENLLQPLFKLSPSSQLGMEFIQVFQCTHNGPFTLNPEEIDEGDWYIINDISNRVLANDPILTETFKVIWQQYCVINNSPTII